MAENNLKYEQINWGWLNDYSGYKFAPITFFDTLYTQEGKSFKEEYNTFMEKLQDGRFLVGRAQALATPNADGSSTLHSTSPATTPVYFNKGVPVKCTSLAIDLTGNINSGGIGNYTVQAKTFTGGSFSGSTITASGKIKGGSLEITGATTIGGATTISGALTVGSLQITSANALSSWATPTTIVTLDGTTMKKSTLANVVQSIDSNVFISHNGNDTREIAFRKNGTPITRIRSTYVEEAGKEANYLYLISHSPSNSEDWIGLRIDNPKSGTKTIRPVKYENKDSSIGKNSGVKIYGAVWNDYAEYRDQYETIEPGYCVCSSDNGKVFKTMEKLAPCDGIVSDTFGFAIGDDDICQTPLAVAGRVLAYCEGDRMDYHAGDTVCASANGKVCKMTREEIREYPDRIVGIVSEIPQYEIWNNGVEVKGRIWVNVK